MGAAIPDALHSRADVYALGYAASRAVVSLMWLPTARDEGQAWHLRRVTVFNGAPFLLWGGSILVPMPWQAAVWMSSLLFELLFLIRLQSRDESEAPYQVSHVVERVGLFVMIVLGESIAASINGLDEHWSASSWLIMGIGFVLFAAIWWGYFTVASQAAETALREGGTRTFAMSWASVTSR